MKTQSWRPHCHCPWPSRRPVAWGPKRVEGREGREGEGMRRAPDLRSPPFPPLTLHGSLASMPGSFRLPS
eukprot:21752-Chlamydomonas_euryale.AAC.1